MWNDKDGVAYSQQYHCHQCRHQCPIIDGVSPMAIITEISGRDIGRYECVPPCCEWTDISLRCALPPVYQCNQIDRAVYRQVNTVQPVLVQSYLLRWNHYLCCRFPPITPCNSDNMKRARGKRREVTSLVLVRARLMLSLVTTVTPLYVTCTRYYWTKLLPSTIHSVHAIDLILFTLRWTLRGASDLVMLTTGAGAAAAADDDGVGVSLRFVSSMCRVGWMKRAGVQATTHG